MEQPLHERPCQSPCRCRDGRGPGRRRRGWMGIDGHGHGHGCQRSAQLFTRVLDQTHSEANPLWFACSEQNPSSDNQLAASPFLLLFLLRVLFCFIYLYTTPAALTVVVLCAVERARNETSSKTCADLSCRACADRSHRPRVQLQQQTLGICLFRKKDFESTHPTRAAPNRFGTHSNGNFSMEMLLWLD